MLRSGGSNSVLFQDGSGGNVVLENVVGADVVDGRLVPETSS